MGETIEQWHGIANNVVCATSKASDQPAHTRSVIRTFASRQSLEYSMSVKLLTEHNLVFLSLNKHEESTVLMDRS